MSRRSRLSIPYELHQIKARQVYERRIARGRSGSPEEDWKTARRYLTRYPKIVRAWKCNVIWRIIAFPFWLSYKLPQLFANKDTRPFALDVVKAIISGASLIAAIVAAIGLFVNYQDALKDRELTQERLVTDRFTKAVEQLGNTKEEVVIGGIYSLERIAKDSPKDQWTIMEVLTAFVRKNSSIPPEIQKLEQTEDRFKELQKLDPISIQIQAALTVIGRRNQKQDYTSDEDPELYTKRLDLSNVNLSSANLSGSNLSSANLSGSNLSSANLSSANLSSANLSKANLFYADLEIADFSNAKLVNTNLMFAKLVETKLVGAELVFAKLYRANLYLANLYRADLYRADLVCARFDSTNLSSASLMNANLGSVDFNGANLDDVMSLENQQIKSASSWKKAIYTDAVWNEREQEWNAVDEKANQKRIEAIEQDTDSDSENPPDCSK